jgi:hypothetical protein
LPYRASRYLRAVAQPQPAPWLWSEVDLTRWRRSLAPSAAARGRLSVSVIDLERLSLVSYRALRYLRTNPRIPPNAGRDAPPLGNAPKTSRVLLSSRCQCRMSPSGAINRRMSPSGAAVSSSRSRDRTGRLTRAVSLPIGSSPRGEWWVEEELNLRPHAYQACALTT